MTENGVNSSHMTTTNNHLSIGIDNLSQDDDHDNFSSSTNSQDDSVHDDFELKLELDANEEDVDMNLPLKQVLIAVNRTICDRLDSIEHQLDNLNQYCQTLEEKVETLAEHVRDHNLQMNVKRSGQTVIVGVPQGSPGSPNSQNTPFTTAIGPNVTLITLNSEADYPHGSWLGEETNPECRVRCHVAPTDLLHVNTTCHTAEKMALTLLDYLFDRETQACSNISGAGKHRKKQLDPLLIYGIRCHLVYKFGINDKDWHRIKQNMDSKCRTAFRRKLKGLPLSMKDSESELSMDQTSDGGGTDLDQGHGISLEQATIGVVEDGDLTSVIQAAQVIHTAEGDIQVLHATPEQIAQIQHTHQIQILTGEHLLTTDTEIIQQVAEATHLLPDIETPSEMSPDI